MTALAAKNKTNGAKIAHVVSPAKRNPLDKLKLAPQEGVSEPSS
jgi:hypothetical protein